MRWRLILEEYGPDLQYVPRVRNVVADALSRLDLTREQLNDAFTLAELLGVRKHDIPDDVFPLRYSLFDKEQQKDTTLLDHLRNCLLYTSPSPRDGATSRMPSSA